MALFYGLFYRISHPAMKYVPTHQSFVFEPIATPNKNIQSYFVRNDQSYYTEESFYSEGEHVQVLVDESYIRIGEKVHKIDFFTNYQLNTEKYKFECLDRIYSLIFNELKSISTADEDGLDDNRLAKNTKIILIISDFFRRSEVISFIDIFINQLDFQAIMILPISLCISFDINQNYCCFIYKNGFSFIDDFSLIDTFDYSNIINDNSKIKADDEDFAEEFSRLSVLDEKLKYSCDECGQKEESIDKIKSHINKEHKEGSYYVYDTERESFRNRMRYLFNKDKYEKVSKKVFSIGVSIEGVEGLLNTQDSSDITQEITNAHEVAMKGAQIFSGLEVSKDLWMTGREWRNVRLRILKEKLLFYI